MTSVSPRIYSDNDTEIAQSGIYSEDDTVNYEFYLAMENSDRDADTTSVGTEGDRWDKGTTLIVAGGVTGTFANADTACTAKTDKLVLGAASLVAGSVAFAAALAF